MASRAPQSKWFRRSKCVATMLAFAWVGHGIYARLTTPATTFDQAYARYGPFQCDTPAQDATAALMAAAASVPPPPGFDEPALPEMQWTGSGANDRILDLTEVNAGPWAPWDRPYLRACNRYLSSNGVEASLGKIEALRGLGFRQAAEIWPMPESDGVTRSALFDLARLIAARIRYLYQTGAPEPAWEELQTALWLGAQSHQGTLMDWLVGIAVERRALTEMILWLHERPPPDELLSAMQYAVASLPDFRDAWPTAMRNECISMQCWAAMRFAETGDGRGWLMLSASFDPQMWPARSPLWDLVTVAHHRCDVVNGKFVAMYDGFAQIGTHDFPQALALLNQPPPPGAIFTALDGEPLFFDGCANGLATDAKRGIELGALQMARRQAVLAAIALVRFHREKQYYPDSLGDLVPEYLP